MFVYRMPNDSCLFTWMPNDSCLFTRMPNDSCLFTGCLTTHVCLHGCLTTHVCLHGCLTNHVCLPGCLTNHVCLPGCLTTQSASSQRPNEQQNSTQTVAAGQETKANAREHYYNNPTNYEPRHAPREVLIQQTMPSLIDGLTKFENNSSGKHAKEQ